MVGGAPISRGFADRIGAAGYAPDAVKAVREAERLMETLAW
jgi:methanogenic corrinoid protein MtbC1